MKHTECKDCEFSNGDCGHHFKMDGTTNFDIASLGACDKYGGCMFFKSKAKPKGDLISREALKKAIEDLYKTTLDGIVKFGIEKAYDLIDNAPTVEITEEQAIDKLHETGWLPNHDKEMTARPHGKWEEDWQEDLDFMSRKGWKCPFCKWRTTYGTPNFCMNCGADMRKGGAE